MDIEFHYYMTGIIAKAAGFNDHEAGIIASASEYVDEAFKVPEDTRLYRIGIATHAYADTWAHQNFVGWYDYFNNIGLDVKPDIGHADAEHHPDWPAHRWEDERLVNDEVDNTARFLEAAKKLYGKYSNYIKQKKRNPNSSWKELCSQLIKAMGPSFSGNWNCFQEERISHYNEIAPWLEEFDEADWFNAAIKTKVRGLKDSDSGLLWMFTMLRDKLYWKDGVDKEKTDWFRFQEAVKEHQRLAMVFLDKLFDKMGIDLHSR